MILFLFVVGSPSLCFLEEDDFFFCFTQDFKKSAHGKKISPALSAPFV